MVTLQPDQIELKIHGLTTEDHGRVPARVFANKLKQLVSALEAADKIANGEIKHAYVLANMHMSEPTAILKEMPLTEMDVQQRLSAVPVFHDAVEGIKARDGRVQRLATVVKHVSLLTSGTADKFGFAEVRTGDDNVVRIDDFLRKRAQAARKVAGEQYFDGVVFGTFDGLLDYVDIRGSLPQIKLTLSAGAKEIDCICRREDIDALGEALHRRVRVTGRAIYSGTSPLPMRVEVTHVERVKDGGDFSRWRGSFRPFEIESWEHDA
ncbi:hypothetical protein SCH01S_28_00440 [Sphingomonas changbaiensis NBRC 104936]|uniref:Uncharacterized protein n=1 Tax=Sphingomonas changbaiensis NBRC 104936 TaxID=1219043 RepID=A0A0E9MPX9_9SPHN|nr:hypothetical protein [Sphingomonas changbaiensis]GAO39185.1 hypothetical protein SCH01S_28_00440 [Sphingomonas changbaiensis NBRC 104936]